MQKILRTERLGDGVNVVWEKAGREMATYLSFAQLIELRVNALDIIKNPGNYGFDEKAGAVRYVAFCQPSRHPQE